jgi:aspartate-semialdehyde dehydrogenase
VTARGIPDRPAVAVVGATGAVGEELLGLLGSRGFPLRSLRAFAGERGAGRTVRAAGHEATVERLAPGCFEGIDVAFFGASAAVSREWAPRAVAAGAWVVDKSSAFRMDPACPLVIPEVNGGELDALRGPAIVAVPNCTTIIALMAVSPLHREAGVARMVVSTYQAASGAGAAAMEELAQQARDWSAGRALDTRIFGRQYLFNLFSHDSRVGDDGQNDEERKLVDETRRIWGDPAVQVSATCVRVPVLRAHSESINLTFRRPLTEARARELLAAAPGVRIVDDRAANRFPEPLAASGHDEVLVGRIRADAGQAPGMGLSLFVSGDQIRKGAALNGVQIAERLLQRYATLRGK